jgi:hypothetical protein
VLLRWHASITHRLDVAVVEGLHDQLAQVAGVTVIRHVVTDWLPSKCQWSPVRCLVPICMPRSHARPAPNLAKAEVGPLLQDPGQQCLSETSGRSRDGTLIWGHLKRVGVCVTCQLVSFLIKGGARTRGHKWHTYEARNKCPTTLSSQRMLAFACKTAKQVLPKALRNQVRCNL